MAGLNCEIRWETRLCEVDGELGYFHCWEHWSNVIDASPLRGGGHPEARLGKSMELSSLRTASGGLTLQKSSSATTKTLFWRRWRNTIAPVNWRVSNESLYFIE